MKLPLTIILQLFFIINVLVTAQEPDILIYEGKKYSLLDTPLESYPNINEIRSKIFGEYQEEAGFHTACWRAYVAEWTIEDKQIFLTNIYSCDYYNDSIKSNLQEVFGSLCVNGKVKADWLSKELLVADGKMILYHNDGFQYYFEKEKGFFVENGQLTEVVDYDNSKTKKSEYFNNSNLLLQFINSNIRWDSLPKLENKKIRVLVTFSSGATETPENISVARGSDNPILDDEAKRVVGLLKWDVYYKKGKPVHIRWTLPVVFSEENKRKYSKKSIINFVKDFPAISRQNEQTSLSEK